MVVTAHFFLQSMPDGTAVTFTIQIAGSQSHNPSTFLTLHFLAAGKYVIVSLDFQEEMRYKNIEEEIEGK